MSGGGEEEEAELREGNVEEEDLCICCSHIVGLKQAKQKKTFKYAPILGGVGVTFFFFFFL